MRIKKIHIQNYKSLVDFELDNPPPFCAFVGPNASGKSNIFEALEFNNFFIRFLNEAPGFFQGKDSILSYINTNKHFTNQLRFSFLFRTWVEISYSAVFSQSLKDQNSFVAFYEMIDEQIQNNRGYLKVADIKDQIKRKKYIDSLPSRIMYENEFEIFFDNFSRIFVGKSALNKLPISQSKLAPDASNLSQIIGQIFQDEKKKEDFIEWVQILIPEFRNIEVKKSNIDGSYEFFVYEENSDKPFPKHLISDGTYNILSLMAAVYQSNEPQFLCIEEPENGLHPQAIQLLVDFFRGKCEEEGHHIWHNTHSPTLVRCLKLDEVVLVNKKNGQTKARIETGKNHIDIKTDEAWLSNALGGGVSWSK